jgi:hypothetical protein
MEVGADKAPMISEELSMQTVKTIGLDIAKSMFQVHGVDAAGHSLKLLRSPDFQGKQGHASRFGAKRRETAARLGRMGRREGGPARRGAGLR